MKLQLLEAVSFEGGWESARERKRERDGGEREKIGKEKKGKNRELDTL